MKVVQLEKETGIVEKLKPAIDRLESENIY